MLVISFLLQEWHYSQILNTYFLVTERIIHLCCCRRSRPGRAGSTGPSCSRPGSDEPWQPCYRLGIFILSHIRNQTSRGTLREHPRHAVKLDECNQATCCVCPRFIQSRRSLILGQNEHYKGNRFVTLLCCWLKIMFFFSNYETSNNSRI